MIQCSRCHRELTEAQSYVNQGKVYCEDCLMDIGLSIKECDPWASYVDTAGRKRHGETGAAGMSEIETKIYEYIKGKGRTTRQEVMQNFSLSDEDLKLQLLPMMHSELIKERAEDGNLYLVTIN
jgi:hypothetical protein